MQIQKSAVKLPSLRQYWQKCRCGSKGLTVFGLGAKLVRFKEGAEVIQMCSPIVTPFGPGQSVTVGKRHYSHAYLL